MAGSEIGSNANPERGLRLKKEILKISPKSSSVRSRSVIISVGYEKYIRWEKGANIGNAALGKLAELGADVHYILTGVESEHLKRGRTLAQIQESLTTVLLEATMKYGDRIEVNKSGLAALEGVKSLRSALSGILEGEAGEDFDKKVYYPGRGGQDEPQTETQTIEAQLADAGQLTDPQQDGVKIALDALKEAESWAKMGREVLEFTLSDPDGVAGAIDEIKALVKARKKNTRAG